MSSHANTATNSSAKAYFKSAAAVLAAQRYSALFSSDPAVAKAELRTLLNFYHPDRNTQPDAAAAFAHINALYASKPVAKTVDYGNGRCFCYDASVDMGYGTIYYAANALLFCFVDDAGLPKYFRDNLTRVIRHTRDDLKNKYRFYVHDLKVNYVSKHALLLGLPAGFVPLYLVEKYIDAHQDYKTASWIVSRAFDLNLFFDAVGLNANGGVIPLCLVDLDKHRLLDLSALFFSTAQRLHALDPWQVRFFPQDQLDAKRASTRSSLNLVNAFGLRLFGDKNSTGNKFLVPHGISIVIDYLGGMSRQDLFLAYHTWQKDVVTTAFGGRAFHAIKVSYDELLEYV